MLIKRGSRNDENVYEVISARRKIYVQGKILNSQQILCYGYITQIKNFFYLKNNTKWKICVLPSGGLLVDKNKLIIIKAYAPNNVFHKNIQNKLKNLTAESCIQNVEFYNQTRILYVCMEHRSK